MDPLSAALNVAYAALTLATKIWDATPTAIQAQNAADWGTFTHNIGGFIVAIQDKLVAVEKSV